MTSMVDYSFDTHSDSPGSPVARVSASPRFKAFPLVTEADIARIHRKYSEQIDALEAALEGKESQLQRYREVVEQQMTHISVLTEELLQLKVSAGTEDREAIMEMLGDIKIERMYRRIRPAIVRINLAIGRLANVCEHLTEDTAKSEQLLPLPSFSPSAFLLETLHSTLMKPLADTRPHPLRTSLSAEYLAFQRSKRELSPVSKPAGDDSMNSCEKCLLLTRKVEKLQGEVKRHKRFIANMKGSIEGLVRY